MSETRGLSFVAVIMSALAVAAAGQSQRGPVGPIGISGTDPTAVGSIRGRVMTPEGVPFNGTARVTLQFTNGGQAVIFTDYAGQFHFPALNIGNYVVEIDADRQLYVPSTQSVEVFRGVPSVITINLKYREAAKRPAEAGGATVSVTELDKNIPEKARKEFRRGTQAAQAGKTAEAISCFKKALDIYPDFMMARNDLGVQLLAASRLDEAAEQLRLAVKLDPKAFNPQLNLGIVLARQQQFADAASALGRAVSLNPQSAAARLYAGQVYAALGDADRAERELKSAYSLGGADYVVALFHLGNLYLNRGEREQALKSFEAFLAAAPNAAHAPEARKLVGVLR
ncbi:MAG: tetratricopeptide repeat protein [Acidobacteria bacterium]|nr:tetratricopeptide repeat protein [Acidobacteriota bacterium]MCA1642437.1 tetratricopeptide repeat protein [Acidobacteriota bacterium]